ncbi:Transposase [Pseudorhodobacter antarcticus]|uniref:Transposase n=1 Tax=Pseudorhodobacter antarcticus TaxID=1077947 RepID=A0A1H8NY68_9RHOB|nr:Transposase [Pseudorhodobacter antarcticus]
MWGGWVPRRPSGRFKWPDELKVKIIERIEGGEKIAVIARQVGAKESLVSKWVKDHRDALSRPVDRLGIVEVVGVARSHSHNSQPKLGIACDLHLGDMVLSIPVGYPGTHLAEILRALRAGQ